jgi:hypothetical protein
VLDVPEPKAVDETDDSVPVSEVCWREADAIPVGEIPELEESGPPGCTEVVLDGEAVEDIRPPGFVELAADRGPPGLTEVVDDDSVDKGRGGPRETTVWRVVV